MLGAARDVTNQDVEAEALRHVDLAASVMPGRLGAVAKLAVEVTALREIFGITIIYIGYAATLVLAGASFKFTRRSRLVLIPLILTPRVKLRKLL